MVRRRPAGAPGGVGMGGLVARWFIHEYPERWKRWGASRARWAAAGWPAVLLGVPNQRHISRPPDPHRPGRDHPPPGSDRSAPESPRHRPNLPLVREPLPAPGRDRTDKNTGSSTSPKPIVGSQSRTAKRTGTTLELAGPARSPRACSRTQAISSRGWRTLSTPGGPSPSPDMVFPPLWTGRTSTIQTWPRRSWFRRTAETGLSPSNWPGRRSRECESISSRRSMPP